MNKMKKHLTASCAILVFFVGIIACSSLDPTPLPPINYTQGIFTIPAKTNEIFTKPKLSKILRASKNLSIVLRVPSAGEKVTQEQKQKNSILYNIIEKEFAKAGFIVRDRALFAKVLDQETLDYSKIGLITETDMILELLSY